MELPETLLNAVHYFGRLPGVGEKTAMRQSLFLSGLDRNELLAFGESIRALADLKKCVECGMFCENELCSVCTDAERGESPVVCVVETITDALAIERSGQFRGRLHVLGGVLNPLLGVGPENLNIDRLVDRVANQGIREVILAINPSVEGDATCSYIKQLMESEGLGQDIAIERIGFGMPIGGSLEYLDSMTISKAIENRKKL